MSRRELRILLLEGDPGDGKLLQEMAAPSRDRPAKLVCVKSLTEGLRRLEQQEFDVIVLDLSLPDGQGVKSLNMVLSRRPEMPVVVLSGTEDEFLAIEAVRRGAQDCLPKERTDRGLLMRSLRCAMERKRVEESLRQTNRKLRELAATDELTGLWNRRHFEELLRREFAEARRRSTPLALGMMDIDYFKAVNDTYGHAFGDRVLVEAATVLRVAMRPKDAPARFGGDEFTVLMPNTPLRAAITALERLRKRIAREQVTDGNHSAQVTVSFGLTATDVVRCAGPEDLIHQADEALRAAKEGGRNCIRVWTDDCKDRNVGLALRSDKVGRLRQQVAYLSLRYAETFVQSMRSLVQAVDGRDPCASRHSENVMRYAVRIADGLGLRPDEIVAIRRASLFHDIGKIGVSERILRKPRRLTSGERRVVESHVLIGVGILEPLRFLESEIAIIRHHHERWDGKGYPNGVAGKGIPLGARVVAVADAFDAMISDRPYRKGMAVPEAMKVLAKEAEQQFDPAVTSCFLRNANEVLHCGDRESDSARRDTIAA